MVKRPRRDLCPAPGCGNPAIDDVVHDKRERPWHRSCAAQALADHFRTPLDLEYLDGQPIDFMLPDEHSIITHHGDLTTIVWRAPRDFILHAVRFGGDFGLWGMFIGADNPLGCAPTSDNAVFGDDLDGRLLDFGDFRVSMGLDITITIIGSVEPPTLALVGELFDPKERRRKLPSRNNAPAIYGLKSYEPIGPGDSTKLTAAIYLPTHFERIAIDDPTDWVIDDVMICCFAGDVATEMKLKELRSVSPEQKIIRNRVTILPTFVAMPGEIVVVHLRNTSIAARHFRGRLIGNGKNAR